MRRQDLLPIVIPVKDDLSIFDDNFRNEYGSIRRKFAYTQYSVGNVNLQGVVDLYKEWRDDHEYFILRKPHMIYQETFDRDNVSYLGNVGIIKEYLDGYCYKFVKASKRGNDVYKYLVKEKLKQLNGLDITFFKDNWGDKRTSLLFITLTYDNNRCTDTVAWQNIGEEFHLFCNNLRKRYGHIEFFRTWESTGHFYPHIHVLIGFQKKSFPVFVHVDKKGKRKFRISKHDKDIISSYWHSHVDIQGVDNTKDAIKELTKYVTKDLCSEKGDKTNAMIWLYRKQAYGVSKGFVGLITGHFNTVVDLSEPKATDLIKSEMCNCNHDFEKWEFVGILRGEQLGFSPEMWVVDLKKPPPNVVNLLIHEQERWSALHGNRF